MKIFLLSVIGLIGVATATPSSSEKTRVRIIGEGEEGVAVLQTVEKNPGSYYTSHFTDHFLIYSGEGANGLILKKGSKTLLQKTVTQNLYPGEIETKIEAQDSSIHFSEVLRRFPHQPRLWSKDELAKLKVGNAFGVSYGRYNLVWGGHVKEALGFERNAKTQWVVDAVYEGVNHLMLQVYQGEGGDESDEIRAFVVLGKKALRQLQAHREKTDFYFVYAEETKREAAQKAAIALKDQIRELEIWKVYNGTDEGLWIVAKPLERKKVAWKSTLNSPEKVGVISSDKFDYRVDFPK